MEFAAAVTTAGEDAELVHRSRVVSQAGSNAAPLRQDAAFMTPREQRRLTASPVTGK